MEMIIHAKSGTWKAHKVKEWYLIRYPNKEKVHFVESPAEVYAYIEEMEK